MRRIGKIFVWLAFTVSVLAIMHYAGRALVCDSFLVGGDSMEPTLHRGERVYVNKLVLGARIYRNFDFSRPDLDCFRMPGFGRLEPGDIAVFNYPYARSKDTVSFKINYVYVKRCIGTPGDSVSIVDGYWKNSRYDGAIGAVEMQRCLSETPDSVLVAQGVVMNAFQVDKSRGWTIRNFGPCHVPRKGDCVELTKDSYRQYRRLIQYETGFRPEVIDGKVCVGGNPAETYTFRHSYYFFGGDNVLNSRDSRYFGLVPEEYVVGALL
ncbi:MAG: signal peptidase I [Bacteroidales bacterium]|nr:signal peptidase I [Bacteroidales bacterium]